MIFKKEYKTVYIFSLIFTVVYCIFWAFDYLLLNDMILSSLDKKWYDFKFNKSLRKIFPPRLKEADKRIIIVGIDEETLSEYGWPLPRRHYKDLIENLNKYGAKVIGFDILFFDPDKINPLNDEIFAQALKKHKNVFLGVAIDKNLSIIKPIEKLAESTTNYGSLSASSMLDSDGRIRKIYPFMPEIYYQDKTVRYLYSELCKGCPNTGIPLLGTQLYLYYTGKDINEFYKLWHDELWGDKSFIMNFRLPRGIKNTVMYDFISMKDIIKDELKEEEKAKIKDSIILIGSVAQAAFDHYSTPAGEHTPGVEIHAVCVDNLLNNDYLRSVKWYVNLILVLLYLWIPVFFISKSVGLITLYNAVMVFILMVFSIFMLKYCYNFHFVAFFVPNMVMYIYVVAYKSIVEGKEKRWIKNTFSQYLSPEVVDILVNDPSKLKLGGEKRDVTVCFMDIAGFTSMSEKLDPEKLTNLLNMYLSELSDIILSYKGVIDKYIGDCIMAFWNAPVNLEKHRTYAVKSGLKCLEKIRELNLRNKEQAGISIRIGINSGLAIVGNMGSNKRFAYTVLGDTVNLASRLEGANKYFHTNIMVSDDVYKEAEDEIIFRYIGEVFVVGKEQSVKVWEPYKEKIEMNEDDKRYINLFENGIKYFYERNYVKAFEFFYELIRIREEGLVRFYYELSRDFMENGDKGFDGVFNIRSK